MLSLKTGTYLGEVLDITQAGGLLAGTTSYREGDATGVMHHHENSHLSLVLRGGGVERRERSQFERLPGQVMFFHAGESHQCINKLFPARNLNLEIEHAFLCDNAVTESAIATAVARNPDVKFVMLRMYKELLAGDGLTDTSIKMLLLNTFGPDPDAGARRARPPWVDALRALLHDRWNEQLTLEDLSAAAGVHPVTVSKCFPKYFSCTLGGYMRKLKVEQSLRLIKASRLSLTDVAHECGFSDQSHFTRTFKRLTGFLPSHYQKL